MSMGTQKGGASSSLGPIPMLVTASDMSEIFAGVTTSLEELRRDMTMKVDRVEERARQGQETLRIELTDVKSQARTDQAQLIQNIDQWLAQSLALAAEESEERDIRNAREIERLLNDHDVTYAHTLTSLEKRVYANLT